MLLSLGKELKHIKNRHEDRGPIVTYFQSRTLSKFIIELIQYISKQRICDKNHEAFSSWLLSFIHHKLITKLRMVNSLSNRIPLEEEWSKPNYCTPCRGVLWCCKPEKSVFWARNSHRLPNRRITFLGSNGNLQVSPFQSDPSEVDNAQLEVVDSSEIHISSGPRSFISKEHLEVIQFRQSVSRIFFFVVYFSMLYFWISSDILNQIYDYINLTVSL